MSGRWGPPKRTAANRLNDALNFIASARPEIVARETVDTVCARFGVSDKHGVAHVKYLLAQMEGAR